MDENQLFTFHEYSAIVRMMDSKVMLEPIDEKAWLRIKVAAFDEASQLLHGKNS